MGLQSGRQWGRVVSVMVRPLRIQYPGAAYHVMARGNQGQAIFRDDRDRARFLETLNRKPGRGLRAMRATLLSLPTEKDAAK